MSEEDSVDKLSLIRQGRAADSATVSAPPIDGAEAALSVNSALRQKSEGRYRGVSARQYGAAMAITTTAATIAAALLDELRPRITYLPDRKLHALLYLAQGICYAANDVPLFAETITATDDGVQVEGVTGQAAKPLDDAQYVLVAVTATRYGHLSAMDLESLIRGQGPWSAVRNAPGNPINPERIRRVFRAQDEVPEGTVTGFPRGHRSRSGLAKADRAAVPDDPDEIAAFAAEMRSRM